MSMTEKEWSYLWDDDDKLRAIKRGEVTDQKLLLDIALNGNDHYDKSYGYVAIAAVDLISDEAVLAEIATKAAVRAVRVAAVEKITDDKALIEVVENIEKIDENVTVICAVLEQITDEDFLIKTALTDIKGLKNGWRIRQAAVYRITDEPTLKKVATSDEHELVRRPTVERITDEAFLMDIAINDTHAYVRKEAINKITDEAFIIDRAIKENDEEVRITAVRKINDPVVLTDIAKNDSNDHVRKTAVERITNEKILTELSKTEENAEILYIIAKKTKVDESVWFKIAMSYKFRGYLSVLEHISDENHLISIALSTQSYGYHKAVTGKIKNESALKTIIESWEAKGIKCFSNEEIHDWENYSSHSHGWDYETQKCKKCGKQSDNGEWVDNR